MLSNIIAIQYCYSYLVNQIPVGLLIYSHIPTAIISILFSSFVLLRARDLRSVTLFVVCIGFAGWCVLDLTSWFSFLGAPRTMFAWSLLDMLALIFFIFSYYFLYVFITKKDLPNWQKILGIFAISPTVYWTAIGANLVSFDANTCEAIENTVVALYPYYVEGFVIVVCIFFLVYQYIRQKDALLRNEILLSGVGVVLFLLFFFSSTLGVNLLVNDSAVQYAYNFEIYGLFGMPILLVYLGYLIVRYKAFQLKVFGAQALVATLIVLIASEFAFVNTLSNQILVGITLIIVAIVGVQLTRSVKREIEQRELVENLAKVLDEANSKQEALIHFIGHEVKGFLTKDAGTFASLVDGDFGVLPETLKPLVEHALSESRQGADSVATILKASNLKKGTVSYEKVPFDLKATVAEAVEKARLVAEKKGLKLSFTAAEGTYQMTGDKAQIADHVLRNLIDNAVNYTPTGSIDVSLKNENKKLIFAVKDSGVGITDEDKKRLFTEGGHGADSVRVNVHSTGYGLYIAKQITEAHGGTIRAESDGAGKGSTFSVEFPV